MRQGQAEFSASQKNGLDKMYVADFESDSHVEDHPSEETGTQLLSCCYADRTIAVSLCFQCCAGSTATIFLPHASMHSAVPSGRSCGLEQPPGDIKTVGLRR